MTPCSNLGRTHAVRSVSCRLWSRDGCRHPGGVEQLHAVVADSRGTTRTTTTTGTGVVDQGAVLHRVTTLPRVESHPEPREQHRPVSDRTGASTPTRVGPPAGWFGNLTHVGTRSDRVHTDPGARQLPAFGSPLSEGPDPYRTRSPPPTAGSKAAPAVSGRERARLFCVKRTHKYTKGYRFHWRSRGVRIPPGSARVTAAVVVRVDQCRESRVGVVLVRCLPV